ncbi:MAG: response regulator [Xanthobacteraceae bacterium]|nr:response regulator [Xanthobacteraceae bacterium]
MTNRSPRIAIVDDDASVRKALARLLAASSFEIETYGSAHDFLTSLQTGTPDCLVVDLHMPELTGFDLQRQLAHTGIRIPTIVITAHNEPGLRERCQSAGAAAFLLKPLDGSTLIGVINAATSRDNAKQGSGLQ